MFQKICILPSGSDFPTDIGLIAENLLYYQNVNIVSVPDTVPILINNCGIDTLIELLTNRNLRILFRQNMLGVVSRQDRMGQTITDVTLVSSPNLTIEEMIFRGVYTATSRRGYSKRVANKLLPHVGTISYQENICDLVREDLNNKDYFKQAIIDIIKFYQPSLTLRPQEIEYELIKKESGFVFVSNLNYEEINRRIPNNPKGNIINSTGLILNMLELRGNINIASDLGAEIVSSDLNTQLLRVKFHDIYNKVTKSQQDLYQFNEFVLNGGHAIREVINNGDKNFDDFFQILDKAEKFREWMKNIGENKNIIQEYHNAVTSKTWIDKLPSKAFRWSFFTSAGLLLDAILTNGLGTALGLGLSLGDALLLDKILKGWSPNVFIQNELKPFAKSSNEENKSNS
jgi:hypothetical protein